MPELPEVEALRVFVADRAVGLTIRHAQLAEFSALKTFAPALSDLVGRVVGAVERRGKWLCLRADSPPDGEGVPPSASAPGAVGTPIWLVTHLARAGWLRWFDDAPALPPKPGRGPLAFRLTLENGTGFELTEAGTQKRLAIHVVHSPTSVPAIASLGPEPLAADFDIDRLRGILALAGATQVKGVLRDQSRIAGIGNAYSDEILHAAKLSPFAAANRLTAEETESLFAAITGELGDAVARAIGLEAATLKSEKKASMRVHGRTGQPCPVCGDTVAEVSFAERSLQYCPTCQTGGKKLADRRMSRLLK